MSKKKKVGLRKPKSPKKEMKPKNPAAKRAATTKALLKNRKGKK